MFRFYNLSYLYGQTETLDVIWRPHHRAWNWEIYSCRHVTAKAWSVSSPHRRFDYSPPGMHCEGRDRRAPPAYSMTKVHHGLMSRHRMHRAPDIEHCYSNNGHQEYSCHAKRMQIRVFCFCKREHFLISVIMFCGYFLT